MILVGGWPTPLKNMSSSAGMMKFPYRWKNKNMFQTTNQIYSNVDTIYDDFGIPSTGWFNVTYM